MTGDERPHCGRAARTARAVEREAMARLTGGIVWADLHDGLSQLELTRRAGLSRMTVRKALGL